jgi:uncharacterized protein YybS (DUF2232 family)
MKRDTLVMVKSLFVVSGQIAQVPVDEQETYLRQNFNKSNNINYRDGDKQSLSTTILENQSLTMLIKN